jgi:predicted nucleic acid-binding protein
MMNDLILFDAGLFIGALLNGDPRHIEARPLVEAGRSGELQVCTTTSIISEVYAALTWQGAKPPHSPKEAAEAVRLLIESPSLITVLPDGLDISLKTLQLVETYNLRARRTHDARHAATAICNGVSKVYTYDVNDWKIFGSENLHIEGPNSVLNKL